MQKNSVKKEPLNRSILQDHSATCLCAVAAAYQKYIPIPLLRQITANESGAAAIETIASLAGKSGFTVELARMNAQHLREAHFPAIAQVMSGNSIHYVVLYGLRWKKVSVLNPPEKAIRREWIVHFERRWTGMLLQLRPTPESIKHSRLAAFQLHLKKLLHRLKWN